MPGKDGSDEFKKKVIPILKHHGFKVLATMPHLVTYLQEKFPDKMQDTGMFPIEHEKEIYGYLEWYQNSLRPCVRQFVAFTVARWKAGLDRMSLHSDAEESEQDAMSEASFSKPMAASSNVTPKSLTSAMLSQSNDDLES